jgi:hypothetical protein
MPIGLSYVDNKVLLHVIHSAVAATFGERGGYALNFVFGTAANPQWGILPCLLPSHIIPQHTVITQFHADSTSAIQRSLHIKSGAQLTFPSRSQAHDLYVQHAAGRWLKEGLKGVRRLQICYEPDLRRR